MPVMFNSLLENAGLDPKQVRLARHHHASGPGRSVFRLWRERPDEFERYQSIQGNPVFPVGNHIASFVVTPAGETLFVGMYHVDAVGVTPAGTLDPRTDKDVSGTNLYSISSLTELSEYKDRLTIDWGLGALAWVQIAGNQNKPVREIRLSVLDEPFPGYFQFRCKLDELAGLPPLWLERLRPAKGVYVITSVGNKKHYVGSATGAGGFLERWKQHAAVAGDAMGFRDREATDYQVAILQVSAGFDTPADIVRTEHKWMEKLQSRSMGINGDPSSALSAGQPSPIPGQTR